jgi:hypothetical protein
MRAACMNPKVKHSLKNKKIAFKISWLIVEDLICYVMYYRILVHSRLTGELVLLYAREKW